MNQKSVLILAVTLCLSMNLITIFFFSHRSEQVVHAQELQSLPPGCISTIPKSWGQYRGSSVYGLAFEDSSGTIRFLAHPTCGNGLTVVSATPLVDLEVRRP